MNKKDRVEAAYLGIGRNIAACIQKVETRENGGDGLNFVRACFADRVHVFFTLDTELVDSIMELTRASAGPNGRTENGSIKDGKITIDPPNRD
jgi:hypothetical protein